MLPVISQNSIKLYETIYVPYVFYDLFSTT